MLGFDNGVIQFAKFSWKNSTNIESKLFEYHTSPIQKICVVEIDSVKYVTLSFLNSTKFPSLLQMIKKM